LKKHRENAGKTIEERHVRVSPAGSEKKDDLAMQGFCNVANGIGYRDAFRKRLPKFSTF
jgi:hypothetical protein